MYWWVPLAVGATLGQLKSNAQNQARTSQLRDAANKQRESPFLPGVSADQPMSPPVDSTGNMLSGIIASYGALGTGGGGEAKAATSSIDKGIPLKDPEPVNLLNPRQTGNEYSLFAQPAPVIPSKTKRSSGAASSMEYDFSTGEWYQP